MFDSQYHEATITPEDVPQLRGPAVIEFGANWCGICGGFTPHAARDDVWLLPSMIGLVAAGIGASTEAFVEGPNSTENAAVEREIRPGSVDARRVGIERGWPPVVSQIEDFSLAARRP